MVLFYQTLLNRRLARHAAITTRRGCRARVYTQVDSFWIQARRCYLHKELWNAWNDATVEFLPDQDVGMSVLTR